MPLSDADLTRAAGLHAAAIAYNRVNRPTSALTLLRQALSLLGTVEERSHLALVGRIWLTVAMCEVEINGPASALQALGEAERHTVGDDELSALVLSQQGGIMIRTGEFGQARILLDRALSLESAVRPDDLCNMLLSRSGLELIRGSIGRAREDLERAIDLAAVHSFRLEQFKALHNLGYLEFLAGDIPLALRRMDEALSLGSDLPRGIPLLDRARVLAEAGLIREADEALAAAAEIFRRDRLAQDLAEVELSRAECALLSDEPEAARRLAVRARARFRRRSNVRWERSADLLALQADLVLGRRHLSGPATDLANDLRDDGLRNDARMAALVAAEALLAEGTPAKAQAMFDQVGTHRAADPISVRLHARYVQGRLARGPAAARAVRTGLRELADYQARFGSIDLQTASAVHGRRLADLDVSLALHTDRAPRVLAAAERGRAVSNRLPVIRPPRDEDSAGLLADLRQTVENLRAVELDRVRSAPLLQRRRELEQQIAARSWTTAGPGSAERPIGYGALRADLAETDTTMAYYLRADNALHAITVTTTATRMHHLGSADVVDELVRRVRADLDVLSGTRLAGPLRHAAAGSLHRALKALDGELLDPLGLPDGRLLVIPTGSLGALPWTLLPSRRGVPVVVAPSASAWARIPRKSEVVPNLSAIAGPGLERADREVDAIAGSRAVHGANCADLVDALADSTVVHVAAHGRHQTENPLFSSLRMADGPLFAHELAQAAEHVVLSACDLGLATIRPGDEALGLTSVLLHLGTRSVVSGVARVEDGVAAEAMVRYHHALAAGHDSALALATALRETTDAEPVPFVCFGATYAVRTAS